MIIGIVLILFRCANGDSLKQLSVDPFLVHTSESQTNFDRLISDSDSKKKKLKKNLFYKKSNL